MNVLVTGGAGYIGGYCVDLLIKKGIRPIIVDNLCASARPALSVPFYQVDLHDETSIRSIIRENKVDALMHFAAYAYVEDSVNDPVRYYHNNLASSIILLNAMIKEGVKKMIFSSSCVVYGSPSILPITEDTPFEPVNPYGHSKLFFEKILTDSAKPYGLSAISLRYFNASGAALDGSTGEPYDRNRLIPKVLDVAMGKKPYLSIFGGDYATKDGTCQRDFIHVLDLASAHILALDNLKKPGHEAYNLGTGTPYSIKELVDQAEKVTQKPIPCKLEPRRAGDPAVLYANPTKAIQQLGWKIQYSDLKTILESAWLWHSRQK